MNKLKIIPVLSILALSLGSCFKEDKPISPYHFSGESFTIQQSIYNNQLFYSLETNSVVATNSNGDWDLNFESSSQGWRIRVNSGNMEEIYQTGIFDFSTTQFQINSKNWRYDKSNGNPDSTAIGAWVNTATNPFVYSGQVYLIGQYNGTSYIPLKKLVFNLVNDSSYQFKYADLNGNNLQQITIRKDTSSNSSYFSLSEGRQVTIEPKHNTWDLLFCQYTTTLFANGIAVPYFVRGVLINPNNVKVALDSVKGFDQISINDISGFKFSTDLDFIGYNWKSVAINIQANTGTYSIRSNYTYIIRDVAGTYYKFKFLSFYNSQGVEGYPAFEFLKL